MSTIVTTYSNLIPRNKYNSKKVFKIIVYSVLGIFAFLQLFPLFWLVSYSLQKSGDLFGPELFSLPTNPVWSNYAEAWIDGKVLRSTINSIIVVGLSVSLSTVISFMGAYACSRMKWKFRKIVYGFLTLGMVIPIQATLLPNFKWFGFFGLIDSYAGVIVPYIAFTLSFNILVYSAHLRNIPKEMEESAFIDGAGYFRIISQIIAPMAKPATMTVVIMTFISNWNEFIMAYTYLSSDKLKTLPFVVVRFQGEYASDYAVQFAAMALVALPCIALYFVFSKYIISGATAGAVKG